MYSFSSPSEGRVWLLEAASRGLSQSWTRTGPNVAPSGPESQQEVEVVGAEDVPGRQAVGGVRRCLGLQPLPGAAVDLGGTQAWGGGAHRLGGWTGDHVVGGPGGLVWGGGQGPPLESGVLTHQRGALWRRGRRQVSQRGGEREGLVSVTG